MTQVAITEVPQRNTTSDTTVIQSAKLAGLGGPPGLIPMAEPQLSIPLRFI
jgi:hypothetical protein